MTSPILVTGADRSGTTLMYALLAGHPDVSMVRRTNMWRWFYGRFGDLRREENLARCLDALMLYRRLSVLEPDRERIEREFASLEPTYGNLFSLFHRHHADREGKAVWGDKSLHTEHFADVVLAELPSARMIQMVRDPRDRYASVIRRYEGRAKSLASVTARWVASVRVGRRNLRRHPASYLMVRFEDLVARPEEVLREVCGFVGLSYDARMLGMQGADADDEGNSSFERIPRGVISPRPVGRYRAVLDPLTIASIQGLAHRRMEQMGYDLDRLPLSPAATMRFRSVTLPSQALRFGISLVAGEVDLRRSSVPEHRLQRQASGAGS